MDLSFGQKLLYQISAQLSFPKKANLDKSEHKYIMQDEIIKRTEQTF
jgi:hypothetical protein